MKNVEKLVTAPIIACLQIYFLKSYVVVQMMANGLTHAHTAIRIKLKPKP